MKHFKHILAATDLSPQSYAAVQYAAHLAQGQKAKLTVIHVPHSISLAYTDFVPPVDMVNIEDAIESSARDALEKWAKRHLRRVPDARVVLRRGVTHEAICKYAEECGASVIVVATHGRKGIAHLALGSVAEQIVRHAPCPVLVIKPPKPAIAVASAPERGAARESVAR